MMKKDISSDARDWNILFDEDKYPAQFPQHTYNARGWIF